MDIYFFHLINDIAFKYPLLDKVGIFCAKYLGWLLIIFLLFLLAIKFKNYQKVFFLSLFSAVLSRFVFAEFIRLFVYKDRPFLSDERVNLLFIDYSHVHHSFPSGHASFFFGLAFLLFLYNRKLGKIFLFLTFLISLARVFVGIHWPADILSGAVLGMISALSVYLLWEKFLIKKQ